MKNPRIPLLFFVWLPALIFAQTPVTKPNLDNYQPARANGPLPVEFLISTAEKAAKDKEKIDQSQDKKMQEAQEQFYLQTNYSVDQMRFSGEVLVNDTFSLYINRVADSLLLKQDPELRHKLKFYILRSPVVNAFTTDQGAIFVTMGLLTRLHNESELAFVIAHEVIHYKRNHVLTGYVEGVKAKEGIGQYDQTTFENRFLKRHRYSRAYESQADDEGFELLVNSNYDPHAGIAAFDILAMADAPFADTLFTKSFFETGQFRFPSKFYVDTIKPYKPAEDEDDDLATHPSVQKRRKVISRKFGKLGADTTGAKYLVSETMFWKIRNMARFEEVAEHTAVSEFNEAIYSDYAVQKVYPDNHYLTREMIRSMYGSVIKKNRLYDYNDLNSLFASLFSGAYDDNKKPVGEQGRLTAFINKTDATGWNVAALNYAWRAHTMFPDDPDITLWTRGLFRELTVKNDIRMDDFEKNDSLFQLIGRRAQADSAIAKKIRGNTPDDLFQAGIDYLGKDSLEHVKYWEFAFVDELKDSGFVQMFREAELYADSLDRVDSAWSELSQKEKKVARKEKRESFSAPQGMTDVVAVNPVFVSYSYDAGYEEVDVKSSFEGQDLLMDDMKNGAQQYGLNLQVLGRDNMDTGSVGRFNDLVTASEWFDQRQDYNDNQILPYPQEKMKELAGKYGTKYFMWSAYLSYKKKGAYYIAIVYDVTTGKPVFVKRTQMHKYKKAKMKKKVGEVLRLLTAPKETKK